MAEDHRLGMQLREKVVELLVRVEHMEIMNLPEGLAFFGMLCELSGRCCGHLAAGRRARALEVANMLGLMVPEAFPPGGEREALEEGIEEILAVLEHPGPTSLH